MGCRLPVAVTRAAARAGWTGWTGWTGCWGSDLANVVWNRDSAVVLALCLRLGLAGPLVTGVLVTGALVTGALVTGVLVTGVLVTGALVTGALDVGVLALALFPNRTSPISLLVSRLNISRRRGSCLRGCSFSLMTGGGGGGGGGEVELGGELELGGEVAAKVGKNGVAVVEGSVGTRLSEMVGRNTEDTESSKLTSSSPSELF